MIEYVTHRGWAFLTSPDRIGENRFEEFISFWINPLSVTMHRTQNSATMGTDGYNLISLLIISTYMMYMYLLPTKIKCTPICYTTRLNYAPHCAGLPNLAYIHPTN